MKDTEYNIARFCQAFSDTSRPRFVFGVTVYAKDIARKFPITGFIDEFVKVASVDGLPILTRAQVPEDAMVVSGIADAHALTAQRALEQMGVDFIDFYSFYHYFSDVLEPVAFYHGEAFRQDYQQYRCHYDLVRHKLADADSRTTFDKIVSFRLSNNIAALEGFTCRLSEQYFDFPFINDHAEHFIDCGGFDGATSLEFARRFPQYKTIQCFEPDPLQCAQTKTLLKALARIEVHPYGVSDTYQKVRFSAAGSASKVCEDGENTVEVVSLDEYLKGPASFIKMDIEGYEINALEGARRIIIEQRPLLAICCYHRPDDLRKIPQLVMSYYSGYKIYLRHYTEGLLETVFYFVPGNNYDE